MQEELGEPGRGRAEPGGACCPPGPQPCTLLPLPGSGLGLSWDLGSSAHCERSRRWQRAAATQGFAWGLPGVNKRGGFGGTRAESLFGVWMMNKLSMEQFSTNCWGSAWKHDPEHRDIHARHWGPRGGVGTVSPVAAPAGGPWEVPPPQHRALGQMWVGDTNFTPSPRTLLGRLDLFHCVQVGSHFAKNLCFSLLGLQN